jgi:hypothetical protein
MMIVLILKILLRELKIPDTLSDEFKLRLFVNLISQGFIYGKFIADSLSPAKMEILPYIEDKTLAFSVCLEVRKLSVSGHVDFSQKCNLPEMQLNSIALSQPP